MGVMIDIPALEGRMLDLRRFFPPDVISWKPGIKSKAAKDWRPGQSKDGIKIAALAYGDFRAYQKRLDEVCGGHWSVQYLPWGADRLICELTIFGVTRSGTGEYSEVSKDGPEGTAAEAQAFKRACAMFGLGRYLYDLSSKWVAFDPERNVIADAGKAELDGYYATLYKRADAKFAELVKQAAVQNALKAPATPTAVAKAEMKADAVMDAVMADVKDLVDAAGLTDQAVITPSAPAPVQPEAKPAEPAAPATPAAAPAAPAVPASTGGEIWADWKGIADAKKWAGQFLEEPEVASVWIANFKTFGKMNESNRASVFAAFVDAVNTAKAGK